MADLRHSTALPALFALAVGATSLVGPPSDAVVLLGPGSDASSWQATDGSAATWPMSNGILQSGKGLLQTKAEFADIQLHVEFATPSEVKGNSQERGNSGVFLAGVFFNGDTVVAPAVVTVFHNGILVHNARPFWGPTAHRRIDPYKPSTARGPIRLQERVRMELGHFSVSLAVKDIEASAGSRMSRVTAKSPNH